MTTDQMDSYTIDGMTLSRQELLTLCVYQSIGDLIDQGMVTGEKLLNAKGQATLDKAEAMGFVPLVGEYKAVMKKVMEKLHQ